MILQANDDTDKPIAKTAVGSVRRNVKSTCARHAPCRSMGDNSARGALMSKTTFILGATPVAVLVLAGCSHTTSTKEIVTPVPAATAAPPAVIVANAPPPPA